MVKSFFFSKEWALWAWGGLILLISSLWVQVQFTVAINGWYGKFYNLMQIYKNNFFKYKIYKTKKILVNIINTFPKNSRESVSL